MSPEQLVNVASMAGRLGQVSSDLQAQFSSPELDREELLGLMGKFQEDVAAGVHKQAGWSGSNYGMSKLGLIAYTLMVAREEETLGSPLKVNCCCPGYCDTDMSSHMGPRSPEDGARNAAMLALQTPDQDLNGVFIQDYQPSRW